MKQSEISLTINGVGRSVDVPADTELLGVLLEDLQIRGPKYGCGEGRCGACKVLVDGVAIPTCITPVGDVVGKEITTAECFPPHHPLAVAFDLQGVSQCGFCKHGMLMAACSLLNANSNPTEAEIVTAMDPNVCRCGTQPRVLAAIQQAIAPYAAYRRVNEARQTGHEAYAEDVQSLLEFAELAT